MKLSLSNKKVESSRLPQGVSIQPRKPHLDDFSNLKKYWFRDNPVATHFINVFSIMIPPGERFFIKSVKNYESKIKDPELRNLVKAFIQQEAQHFKAHDDLNEEIKKTGVDIDTVKRASEKVFQRVERWVPKKLQLGMTVFAEHMTATGAEIMLTVPEFQEAMPPEMREFWLWHAVEELEHKAVAFDVLEEQWGSYFARVASIPVLILLTARPNIKMIQQLLRDDGLVDNKEAIDDLKRFSNQPAAIAILKRNLKRYFALDFHPWEHDSREATTRWYAENPDLAA